MSATDFDLLNIGLWVIMYSWHCVKRRETELTMCICSRFLQTAGMFRNSRVSFLLEGFTLRGRPKHLAKSWSIFYD